MLSLILISSDEFIKNEMIQVVDFFVDGLKRFHLRKPKASKSDMESYIREIPEKYRHRIVLHSYPNLVKTYKLGGIHINRRNRLKVDRISYKNTTWSSSLHTLEDLEEASKIYDYAFLSPIFDSISKLGYKSTFDKKLLKDKIKVFKQSRPKMKIYALGGVDKVTILRAKKMGFDGVAIFGAVWQSPNRKEVLNALIQKANEC